MDDIGILKLVNLSGFPFQERIRDEIIKNLSKHGWSEASFEHRWSDHQSKDTGFIDLILEKNDLRVVIECKRVRQKSWIFLNPKFHPNQNTAKILRAVSQGKQPQFLDWIDTGCPFEIPVSYFCIRESEEPSKPMLERITAELMMSVENLAREELDLFQYQPENEIFRFYIPLIVTNADLCMCKYDTGKVDLETGELDENGAEMESVQFVRFQKSLPSTIPMSRKIEVLKIHSLSLANSASQRTVFIVHASALSNFLQLIYSGMKPMSPKHCEEYCQE